MRVPFASAMLRLIYTPLVSLAAPVALAVTAWRGIRDPAYRDRLGERLGFTQLHFDKPVIWVHAVSMGEVQAAAPLVRALLQRHPDHSLLVTTATPTGAARVAALFGDTVRHAFLPYDTPGAVNRFLARIAPCIAIVMETEVWPNLFRACARRRIPIVMASARLSEKSVRRLRWLAGLFESVLAANVTIAAQTQLDADRFIALGATRSRVPVVGNLKYDVEIPTALLQQGKQLREEQFAHRFVWVAGSTHEGEEQILLDAYQEVRARLPGALLVLVPRHPQRFAAVRQWLTSQAVPCVARSDGAAVSSNDQVLLVDTLGELLAFYAACDVAFVGGSLVAIGGHNLLEPAALGVPVLAGPNNFNAPDIAQLLFTHGAAREVRTANELSNAVVDLALDARRRHEMGAQGAAIVAANRGALSRILALIEPELARAPKGC